MRRSRPASSVPSSTVPAAFAAAYAAWALFILYKSCSGSPGVLGRWAAFLGWGWVVRGEACADAAAALFLLAGAWGGGVWAVRLLSPASRGLERFVLAEAAGLAALSLGTLGSGLLGLVGPWPSAALAGAGLAAGCAALLRPRPAPPRGPAPRWRSVDVLLALGLLAAALLHLVGALAPETYYDSFVYHLGGPSQYLARGRVAPLETTLYTHFPQNMEMLYLLGLSLRGETAAKLLHFATTALTGAGLCAFGAALFGRRAGLVAAALFATVPVVGVAAWRSGVELGAALWTLCGAFALLRATEGPEPDARLLAFSGLMFGAAMGTKYTEVWAAAASFIVLCAAARHRPKAVALWALAAVLPLSPWLLKNAWFTGNPVSPFLSSVFGGQADAADALALDARGHFWHGGALSWRTWLLVPSEMFLKGRSPFSFIGPLLVLFAPLVFTARRLPRPAGLVLALFGVHYALWAASSSMVRLLIPALPLWCLFAAAALEALPPRLPWTALVVIPAVWWNLCWDEAMLEEMEIPPVVFARESRESFLGRKHLGYPYPLAIEAPEALRLGPDSRVLLVGDARRYPLTGSVEASGPFETPRLFSLLEGVSDLAALDARLRDEGFTHVVVNLPEFRRLWLPKAQALEPGEHRLLGELAARGPVTALR